MIITLLNIPLWIISILLLLIGIILIGLSRQSQTKQIASIASGLLVSYITILILIGAGEAYFRFSYADSGWGFTLAHQNWEERYWQKNSRGFRDQEWADSDFLNQTTIAILGDSFASGWGVNNPADRFPNVLATSLGEDYAVINLAQPGTSTPQQMELLQENPPQQPDIVILQYFLNDIELASASVGQLWLTDFVTPPEQDSIASQTHFGNYIYWAIFPLTHSVNATFEGSYWQWQYDTYDNFTIWEIHEQQIHDFIDYIESLDAELYVVIFPNMEDSVSSVPYVDRVKFVFEGRGYTDHVMTLYDEVASWDSPEALTASPRDAHPSAAFHRFVGELIYTRWFE